MTTSPTAEEAAREILAILVIDNNCLSGDVLNFRRFRTAWTGKGFEPFDFKPGMDYAIHAGWVEEQKNGALYQLTDSGLAAASMWTHFDKTNAMTIN